VHRQYHAFDVIRELTFDEKLGFGEKGADVNGIIEASMSYDMLDLPDLCLLTSDYLVCTILVYSTLSGHVPALHKLLIGNPLILDLLVRSTLSYFT